MKNYIVHDIGGNILRTGVCPDDLIDMEAGEGETVIEGVASDVHHIIVDGTVQDRPIDILQLKASAQELLRVLRNSKLVSCDWTVGNDSPLSEVKILAWQTYRTALRNMPADHPDILSIDEVVWPVEPS